MASVTGLERRARWHARRLGLQPPGRTPLPRSDRRLARRAAQLQHVVAFLRAAEEVAPTVDRPAAPTAAKRRASSGPGFARAARESARLGITAPAPPRAAADTADTAVQSERWRDVDTWLARSSERRRPAELNASAAAVALRYRGTPYVYGGASPGGFDCSGLVAYAFGRIGKELPHNTNAIWSALPRVRGGLRPGDLVFFSGLGHMGIYVGHGGFVHAPHTGDVVKVEPLASRDDYVGAVRA